VSADLVGSTAYKGQSLGHRPNWAPTFKEFFSDFPLDVKNSYSKVNGPRISAGKRLRPWKFSGDEILFLTELSSYQESIAHLSAFKNAVVEYPNRWKTKRLPLTLKATAWLAGFPVTNTELEIATGTSGRGKSLDFIGPSIDLGFRIAKFADERRMILSA